MDEDNGRCLAFQTIPGVKRGSIVVFTDGNSINPEELFPRKRGESDEAYMQRLYNFTGAGGGSHRHEIVAVAGHEYIDGKPLAEFGWPF